MDFTQFEPCFLIAMPELNDPNFQKTVILLTDYQESGASGFVINRPTTNRLGEAIVLSQGTLNPGYADVLLWNGGPVEPERIWLFYDEKHASFENAIPIGDGIMMARDADVFTNLEITIPKKHMRIFHGYAGWGEKQLNNEIAQSSWITCPLDKKLLFDTEPEAIWRNAIKAMGFDPEKLVSPHSVFVN